MQCRRLNTQVIASRRDVSASCTDRCDPETYQTPRLERVTRWHRLAQAPIVRDMTSGQSQSLLRFSAALISVGVLLSAASTVSAQRPREIGRTAANNPVLVEPRSVQRDGGLLHATIRVKFAKAVRAPGGDWWSSRTRLTFDCTKRTVAILENWYYGDTTWTRVTSHNVVGQPGYGTVMGGSMTSVGYDSLCPVR